MARLQKQLEEHHKMYDPFHMPGHKRNTQLLGDSLPYEIDITEIEEFDDLHHPEGILQEIEKRASKVFGSQKSFLLVNREYMWNFSWNSKYSKTGK